MRIHYDVDFGKRSTEREYRELLKKSGVILKDIRIDNDATSPFQNLTFGSYVNEDGISEKEKNKRYEQFWQVSQYINDMAY